MDRRNKRCRRCKDWRYDGCKYCPEDFYETKCTWDECGRPVYIIKKRRYTIVNGCPTPSRRYY